MFCQNNNYIFDLFESKGIKNEIIKNWFYTTIYVKYDKQLLSLNFTILLKLMLFYEPFLIFMRIQSMKI